MDLLAARRANEKGWRLMRIAAGLCLIVASMLLLASLSVPSSLGVTESHAMRGASKPI